MKIKPKGEASAKRKSCFLGRLMGMLRVQIQMQGCEGAVWVLPATVRYISVLCPLQRDIGLCLAEQVAFCNQTPENSCPYPRSLYPPLTFYLQNSTLHVLSLYKYARSHSSRKPFFMPFYIDAFGLSHKPLSCLLASPGLVINTSQVQTLIKLEVQSSQA